MSIEGLSKRYNFWIASFICAAWILFILALAFQPFEEQDVTPLMEKSISEETLQKMFTAV